DPRQRKYLPVRVLLYGDFNQSHPDFNLSSSQGATILARPYQSCPDFPEHCRSLAFQNAIARADNELSKTVCNDGLYDKAAFCVGLTLM
ncbi:MAG: hypothetical protein K8F24_01620, partial [Bacteroidales bacterium]|nr:hypothetical protein [Bacteroidales bacterium]